MDAPERILAWKHRPEDRRGEWEDGPVHWLAGVDTHEYVRADIHAAALDEVERLQEAEQAAYIKGLENAVEMLRSMKATPGVLHEGTISLAVSGLSITITKARAALAGFSRAITSETHDLNHRYDADWPVEGKG